MKKGWSFVVDAVAVRLRGMYVGGGEGADLFCALCTAGAIGTGGWSVNGWQLAEGGRRAGSFAYGDGGKAWKL